MGIDWEEILDAESEDIKKIQRNITIKEDSEKYNFDIHINKKHDKLFKELLSDKKEAVKFINHYLHLNLLDDEIEKYEKEFRTEEFRNIEADVVYKVKNKNVFILIEHQSSLDLKMAYRILRYKNAIIESAINKRRLKEKNYKIPKVIPIVLYTGKRKWQKLSIEDIEEKIEGYEEIKPGYDLVDTNEFTKQQLLEDNLVTSKAMLIEKSQNKEELYQNIEDIISCKNKMEDFEYEQLEKIVSLKLIQDVEDFLNQMSNQYNILFETKTLYGLALHIDTAIIQTSKKQRLSPKEKNDFIQQFPEYYKQTQQFIKKINDDFGIHLPNDEVIMVMLFLICGQEEIHHQEVVTLIAMHGEHTATSIVDVVKKLSGKQSIYGYDLKLDQTINKSYEELKEYILHIHQGKGMILIYDMGSIRTMAESIKIELNIDIEFLEIPLTLIAMTSVNKAHELLSLNETYQYLQEHFKDLQYVRNNSQKEALVLISSLESELVQAKNYLLEHFDLKDIEIFLIQESQIESIYNRIDQIASQYKIKGLISRQEIHLSQYIMISISNVYKLNAKSLDDLFTDEDDLENLFDYLQEQFEDIQIEDLKQPLIHFANKLEIILNQKIDYDTLIGLLIHIICLIDRLKKHLSPAVHFQAASDILTKDRSTVEKVKEILLPIEQICRITISDVEAATIISIIKGKKQ